MIKNALYINIKRFSVTDGRIIVFHANNYFATINKDDAAKRGPFKCIPVTAKHSNTRTNRCCMFFHGNYRWIRCKYATIGTAFVWQTHQATGNIFVDNWRCFAVYRNCIDGER